MDKLFGEGFDGFCRGIVFDAGEVFEEHVISLVIVVGGVAIGVNLVEDHDAFALKRFVTDFDGGKGFI